MISRLRTDGDRRLFEVFLELAHSGAENDSAIVLQKYPEHYSDEEVLKPVPKFSFPYSAYISSSTVEHFTFVLTDVESKFRFGFCRLTPPNHTCLCFISCLPWYEVFYELLDELSAILNNTQGSSVIPLLSRLHSITTLSAGENVCVATLDTKMRFSFIAPDVSQLPSIPENRNLTEMFNLLDVNNLMAIFASLIHERRVLIVSERLSRLTACVHAAALLLYPMSWQHLYIPVLPSHLLDYCSSDVVSWRLYPYSIRGVYPLGSFQESSSSIFAFNQQARLKRPADFHDAFRYLAKMKQQELGDAVILNVDSNHLRSEYDDLTSLPPEVVGMLKRLLKQQYIDRGTGHVIGDSVSRAFLKTLVALIGGYRDALKFRAGEQITFDREAFVQSRPITVQPFLRRFLQMQIFEQFVADRLEMLNAGAGFSDEFEIEANMCADKWGAQSRYKSWLNDMKVSGRKFQREGKDRWSEFTSRMKDKSKKTIKDIKSKMDENNTKKDDASTDSTFYVRSGSAGTEQRRPPRPPPPSMTNRMSDGMDPVNDWQSSARRSGYEKIQHYTPINIADSSYQARVSLDDSGLLDSRPAVNTDLLSDPDILNMFRKSYSLEELNAGTGGSGEQRLAPLCDSEDDGMESDEEREENMKGFSTGGEINMGKTWVQFTSDSSDHVAADEISLTTPSIDSLSISSHTPSYQIPPNILRSTSHPTSNSYNSLAGLAGVDPFSSNTMIRPTPVPRETILRRTHPEVTSPKPRPGSEVKVRDQPLIELEDFSPDEIELDPLKATTPEPARSPPAVVPRTSKLPSPTTQQQIVGNTADIRNLPPATKTSRGSRARAAFIEAEAPKPVFIHQSRLGSLDQFDPLATGQLAVDAYESSSSRNSPSSSVRSNVEEEENLLKEWNLDVRYRGIPGREVPPGIPSAGVNPSPVILAAQLQTPVNMQAFSSMPNLAGGNFVTLPPGIVFPAGNIAVAPLPYQNYPVGFSSPRPMASVSTPAASINRLPGNSPVRNFPTGNSMQRNFPADIFPMDNSHAGFSHSDVKSATLPVNSSLTTDLLVDGIVNPMNNNSVTSCNNGGLFAHGNTASQQSPAKQWEKFE